MPSKRQMRRAYQRYGEAVYEQEVIGKHSKAKNKRTAKPMSLTYKKKLRALYLRADILVVPYSEHELKTLMQKAREEYDKQGMITTATSVELVKAGKNVTEIESLWDDLKSQNIKVTFKGENNE